MGLVVQNSPGGVVKIVQGGTTQVVAAGIAQTSAGAFSPPSGTGFIHITGGVMDAAARNPLASEVPGFDGVTVTGVPTAGQVPIASSGTAAAWGTLIGGITQLTGDVTAGPGSGSQAATVVRVNGATVPGAGGLATGNVLQVSGASALTYGPVNLAGGSNYVTGVLPTGNQASQTLGGDLSGTTAAGLVRLASTASHIDLGGTVASAGSIRAANNTNVIVSRNAASSADIVQVCTDSSNDSFFGSDQSFGNISAASFVVGQNAVYLRVQGAATYAFASTGNNAYFGGSTTAASLYFDFSGQPLISSGTSNTSLTIGTNKVAASFVIQADAANKNAAFSQSSATVNRIDFYSPNGTSQANATMNNGFLFKLDSGSSNLSIYAAGSSTGIDFTSNVVYFSNGIHKLTDWSTGTFGVSIAPVAGTTILANSAVASLTIGTAKAGASLVLAQDANITAWTLSGGNALAMTAPATAASVTIGQTAASSGGANWTITAQSAGGTNDGGSLALSGGAHSGSNTVDGSVKIVTPLNAGFLTLSIGVNTTLTNLQSNANVVEVNPTAGGLTLTFLRRIADTSLVVVRNTNGGGISVTISYLTGGTVSLASGTSAVICSDGANLQKVVIGT